MYLCSTFEKCNYHMNCSEGCFEATKCSSSIEMLVCNLNWIEKWRIYLISFIIAGLAEIL